MVIFLEADTNILLQRIKQRNRLCEQSISDKYLDSLRESYDIVLNSLSKRTDVIRVDASLPADTVYNCVSDLIIKYNNNSIY